VGQVVTATTQAIVYHALGKSLLSELERWIWAQAWQNLSEGQGTVIASMITVIAALGGVVLGWLLFSGRVRSLETALKACIPSLALLLKTIHHPFFI
jgi:hypothetical protein